MSEGIEIELDTKQAAVISLVIGLLVGGIIGFAAGNVNISDTQSRTVDNSGLDNTKNNIESQSPKEVFRQISDDMKLNTDEVMECYETSENNEANQDRNNAVRSVGRFGTPTFFIGNREKGFVELTGAQPFSSFRNAINTIRSDEPGNLTSLDGVQLEGEPTKGQKDAPIKIVEYNEFGCPFCAEWQGIDASGRTPIDSMKIADTLENQYVDTGEVEIISKDYPVPQLHPNGPKAHKAANCVFEHEKDSYWEFHDQLYERRDLWMK